MQSSTLEPYDESRVISLDICKTFGCTHHMDLLAKLHILGLNHTLIKWIDSFLSDRLVIFVIDSFSNHYLMLVVSVISPVLFLLFINDLLCLLVFAPLLMKVIQVLFI